MNWLGKGGLELLRAVGLWGLSLGAYLWLGGASLRLIWYISTIMLAYGVLLRLFGISRIQVRRMFTPSVVQAGDQAELQVELSWRSWLPIPWMIVVHRVGEQRATKVLFPGWRQKASFTCILTDIPRGEWTDIDSEILWGDLFGWYRVRRRLPGQSALTVHPRPMRVTIPDYAGHGGDVRLEAEMAASVRRAEYPGGGVRNYMPGDPLNRIHWKNSARSGKLQTMLPSSGWSSNTNIWLYSGSDGYPASTAFEQQAAYELAVSAAAGLAEYLESIGIMYTLSTAAIQGTKGPAYPIAPMNLGSKSLRDVPDGHTRPSMQTSHTQTSHTRTSHTQTSHIQTSHTQTTYHAQTIPARIDGQMSQMQASRSQEPPLEPSRVQTGRQRYAHALKMLACARLYEPAAATGAAGKKGETELGYDAQSAAGHLDANQYDVSQHGAGGAAAHESDASRYAAGRSAVNQSNAASYNAGGTAVNHSDAAQYTAGRSAANQADAGLFAAGEVHTGSVYKSAYAGPGHDRSSWIIVTGTVSRSLAQTAHAIQSAGRSVTICCTGCMGSGASAAEPHRFGDKGSEEWIQRFLALGGRLFVLNVAEGRFERAAAVRLGPDYGGDQDADKRQKFAY